jgi:hypothetical protein
MVKRLRALIVALLAVAALGAAAGCSDEPATRDDDDLRADLAALQEQIEEARKAAEQHQSGLIGEMAAMRREVLQLSAAMLENRLIAKESGVPTKVVAPARAPDPARAEQLLRHITATEEALQKAREDAGNREGMAGSLSQTAVVTQELTLAQLRLAYFQSAYGLGLPGQESAGAPAPRAVGAAPSPTGAPSAAAPEPAPAPAPGSDPARTSDGGARDVGALIGSAKDRGAQSAQNQPQADLPPLEEVTVPQLPPTTYSRRDYTRIQLLLQEAGFNPGPVDGQWGPRTQGAMADFQRAEGLPPSGEPNAETLDALGFY